MKNQKTYAYLAVFIAMILPLFFTDHYWWNHWQGWVEILIFFILPVVLSCGAYFWVNSSALLGSALSLICVFITLMALSNEGWSDWKIMKWTLYYPIGSIGAFFMSLFPLIFRLKGFENSKSAVVFSAVFTLVGFVGLFVVVRCVSKI